MGFWESAVLLAWVAIIVTALVVYGLSRQVALFLSRGAAVSVTGRWQLDTLPAELLPNDGDAALVLFVSSDCPKCSERLADLAQEVRGRPASDIVLAYGADDDGPMPVSGARSVRLEGPLETLGVVATPYGIVTLTDGSIAGSGPIGSRDALRAMLRTMDDNRIATHTAADKEVES